MAQIGRDGDEEEQGAFAGQVPVEIESWSRAVTRLEAAWSRVRLQKLMVQTSEPAVQSGV